MTPKERRIQALNQQTRIEETFCSACPFRSRFVAQDSMKACKTCHHGHELRQIGCVLNETMADMRLQRSGVMV